MKQKGRAPERRRSCTIGDGRVMEASPILPGTYPAELTFSDNSHNKRVPGSHPAELKFSDRLHNDRVPDTSSYGGQWRDNSSLLLAPHTVPLPDDAAMSASPMIKLDIVKPNILSQEITSRRISISQDDVSHSRFSYDSPWRHSPRKGCSESLFPKFCTGTVTILDVDTATGGHGQSDITISSSSSSTFNFYSRKVKKEISRSPGGGRQL